VQCLRTVLFVSWAAVVGCTPAEADDWPAFVDQLIRQFESGPKKNPPGSIWRYNYKGVIVFYVPPSCCDVPSELYKSDGDLICAPDGGMTGDGDGRCPDFFQTRSEELNVWTDGR
jgi:hypothetical protein